MFPPPPTPPGQSHQRKGETIWSLWKGRSSWSWTGSFLVMLELSASISSTWCAWSLERPCSWRPTCPMPTCLEVRTLSPASGTCARSLRLPNSPIQASLFVAVELAQKVIFQLQPHSVLSFIQALFRSSFFIFKALLHSPLSIFKAPIWVSLSISHSSPTLSPSTPNLALSIFQPPAPFAPGLFSFNHFPHPWLIQLYPFFSTPGLFNFNHFPHPWFIQLYPFFSTPGLFNFNHFPHPWLIQL